MPPRFQLSRRCGSVAAAAVGSDAAQPRRAFHGGGRPAAARASTRRAGGARARAAQRPARRRRTPQTNRGWLARPVPLLDDMLGYYRPALFVLLGAVGARARSRRASTSRACCSRAPRRGPGDGGARRARRVARPARPPDAGRKPAARRRRHRRRAVGALALLKIAIAAMPAAVPRLSHDHRSIFGCSASRSRSSPPRRLLFGLLPALVSREHAGVRGAEGRHPHVDRRARPALEPRCWW